MTIEQVRDFHPEVVVVPIGSTEPHGPHLPYGTDLFIAEAVTAEAVRLANAEDARVLRLPPLPISNNVNFKKFPFACRIRVETLMAVLGDIVDFLTEDGVKKLSLSIATAETTRPSGPRCGRSTTVCRTALLSACVDPAVFPVRPTTACSRMDRRMRATLKPAWFIISNRTWSPGINCNRPNSINLSFPVWLNPGSSGCAPGTF